MPSEPPGNIVDAWFSAELEKTPDCEVLAAIRAATTRMGLNEAELLAGLRKLCEPADPDEDELG
jgi:hypothetical protein